MRTPKFPQNGYYEIFTVDKYIVFAFLAMLFLLLLFLFATSVILKLVLLIFLIPVVLIVTLYLFFQTQTYSIKIKHFTLNLKTNVFESLSAEMKNREQSVRIIFFSDLHFNKFQKKNFINGLIQQVNKLNPDLILLGGDYVVDKHTDIEMLDILSKLKASAKIAVLGNHDYSILDKDFQKGLVTKEHLKFGEKIKKKLFSLGFRVLRNENYLYSSSDKKVKFNIFGPDSDWTKRADFSKYKADKHNLVLMHEPTHFADLDLPNVSFVLAGHNHGGGQIKIINEHTALTATKIFPKKGKQYFCEGFNYYNSGVYENKYGLKMYCSTGIGLTGLSVRINCRPEIVVIDVV